MERKLAWAGVAAGAVYLVYIGGGWWGIYSPHVRITTMIIAAVTLACWVDVMRRDPAWWPKSLMLPAITACLGSLAISTVFSRFPRVSLEYLGYAIVLAALYLLLVQLMTRDFFRTRFAMLATLLFLTTSILYLAFNLLHWVQWWEALGRINVPPLRPEFESLTFGNPSAVLTITVLLAVPPLATADWASRRGLVQASSIVTILGTVAIVSGSRAGWLAMAVAGACAISAATVIPAGRGRIREIVGRIPTGRATRIGAAVGLVAAVAAIVVIAPAVLSRLNAGGESYRIAFVRIALELFRESPIAGTGPGTWVIERPNLTNPSEPDQYIPHAHNLYAQTLAEQGAVGIAAGLLLSLFLARLVFSAIRDRDPMRRRWGWVSMIGLIYFAAHQALDFYPNMPAVLFAAAIFVAYLDGGSPAHAAVLGDRSFRIGKRATAGALVIVTIAVGGLVLQEGPALHENGVVDQANAGNWQAADADARAVAAADPQISAYLFTAGLSAAHADDHDAAIEYFRQVAQRDDLPEAWLNLAAEQWLSGNAAAVSPALRAAMRLGFQRPAVAAAAGDLAFRTGNHELAVEAFGDAVIKAPSLLGDPWWTQSEERTGLQKDVLQSALERATPDRAWELALMVGDAPTARRLALASNLGAYADDFIDAWTGDQAAAQRLIAGCRARPVDLFALAQCARIEARNGHAHEAEAFRFMAYSINGGGYGADAELRVAPEAARGRVLEGDPAIFWGAYTYRRFTPWDVLVPSLIHLTLE